jgi:hypothetical protein
MYWLSITIFTAITVVIFSLRWWLRHKRRLPVVRWWAKLVGLLVLHGGVVLVIWSANRLDRSLGLLSRPTLKACIVKAEITGGRDYRPEITYHYLVDGKEYTGVSDLQAPGFGGKRKRHDAAKGLLEQYRLGDSIDVTYNPARPEESTLMPRPTWDLYVKLSTGLLLFTVGLSLAVLPRKPRS